MARIGARTGHISKPVQPRRVPPTPPWIYVAAIGVGLVVVGAPDPLPWWLRLLAVALLLGGAVSTGIRIGEARPDPEARQRALRQEQRADTLALLLADHGSTRPDRRPAQGPAAAEPRAPERSPEPARPPADPGAGPVSLDDALDQYDKLAVLPGGIE